MIYLASMKILGEKFLNLVGKLGIEHTIMVKI